MSFPARLLGEGEEVLIESKQHWIALRDEIGFTVAWLFLWIIVVPWLDFPGDEWIAWLLTLVWAVLVGKGGAEWYGSDFIVTTKRVIFRKGLFAKSSHEVTLERLQPSGHRQSAWQRLVGAGDLLLDTGGHDGKIAITDVPGPLHVSTVVNDARAGGGPHGLAGSASMTPNEDIQARPAPDVSHGPKSRAEQLEILARLNADGKLTDEEFAAEKRRLLESD